MDEIESIGNHYKYYTKVYTRRGRKKQRGFFNSAGLESPIVTFLLFFYDSIHASEV